MFIIYVVAFNSIKIQTCSAPQNDHQNLNFVKDINVVGDKMTKNGLKMTNSKSCLFNFQTDFTYSKIKRKQSYLTIDFVHLRDFKRYFLKIWYHNG